MTSQTLCSPERSMDPLCKNKKKRHSFFCMAKFKAMRKFVSVNCGVRQRFPTVICCTCLIFYHPLLFDRF